LVAYARQIASQRNTKFARQLLELADEAKAVLQLVEESVPWGNEVRARNYTNKEL
jgi:hypothetical protein